MPNYPILNTPNNIIVELNSVSKLNNNAFNTTLNYSSASVDSFIHVKITINLNELGTILKKASLKVYCSNNADSQLVLKRSNVNKELDSEIIEFFDRKFDENGPYYIVDLTDFLLYEGAHEQYFAIDLYNNTDSTVDIYNQRSNTLKPTVIYEFSELNNVLYQNTLSDNSFSMNLGKNLFKLDLNTSLSKLFYSICEYEVQNFTFNLGLVWDSKNNRRQFYNNLDLGLPKGLKFNIQMFLWYENSHLFLIDQLANKHEFIAIDENLNFFIDSSGSRMIIKKMADNRFLLKASHKEEFIFSENGLLEEIRNIIGDSCHSIFINYEYQTAKISHIFDNNLINIYFLYENNAIIIDFDGYKNQVLINHSGSILTSIEENGFETYFYTFKRLLSLDGTEYILQDITLDNQKLFFTNDYFKRINSVSIIDVFDNVLEKYEFKYGYRYTEVSKLPYDNNNIKVTTHYDFDNEGNCISEYIKDVRGLKVSNIYEYSHSYEKVFKKSKSIGSIYNVGDANLDFESFEFFVALSGYKKYELFLIFNNLHTIFDYGDEDEILKVEIYQNNSFLSEKTFCKKDLHKNNFKAISFMPLIDQQSETTDFLSVRISNLNIDNYIVIDSVIIESAEKTITTFKCISFEQNELINECPDGFAYYLIDKTNNIKYLKDGNEYFTTRSITYEDLVSSIYFKNSLGIDLLFFNNGKSAIYNATNIELQNEISEETCSNIENIKYAKITINQNSKREKNIVNNIFFIESSVFNVQNIIQHIYNNTVALENSVEKFSYNGLKIYSKNANNVESTYSYDELFNLTQIQINKGLFEKLFNYRYDSQNNLTRSIEYNLETDIGEEYSFHNQLVSSVTFGNTQINYEYFNNRTFKKTSYGNVSNEVQLQGDKTACIFEDRYSSTPEKNISYCYDTFGRISAIYLYDNLLVEFFSYSTDEYIQNDTIHSNHSVSERFDRYNRKIETITDNNYIKYYYINRDNLLYKAPVDAQLNKIVYTDIEGENTINYFYDEYKTLNRISQNRKSVFYSYGSSNIQDINLSCQIKEYFEYELSNQCILKETESYCLTFTEKNNQITKEIIDFDNDLVITHQINDIYGNGFIECTAINNNYELLKDVEKNTGYDSHSEYSISDFISKETIRLFHNLNSRNIGDVQYEYNECGKIRKIITNFGNPYTIEFFYNSLGMLTREISTLGNDITTINYSYDSYGNLLRKTKNYEIKTYSYNDRNQLTRSDQLRLFYYDDAGYPTSYYFNEVNFADGLMTQFGETYMSYDAFKRLRRISSNNIETNIEYFDDRIYKFTKIIESNSYELKFVYGVKNKIIGFFYNQHYYHIIYNILNDVIAILDDNYNVFATYIYDGFGKCRVFDSNNTEILNNQHLACIFPFRFRSYYYVEETGLFMMGHRFYDPEIGRFISPDDVDYLDPTKINGLNLYAYCNNDPVNYVDPDGHLPQWANWLIAGAGGLLILGLAIATVATGGTAAGLTGAICAGALKGAIIGGAVGTAAGAGIGYAVDGIDGMWSGMAIGFSGGALVGAIIGGAATYLNYGNFATCNKLDIHFGEHGNEFNGLYSNSAEYARGAKYTIRNGTKIKYMYKGKETIGYIRFFGSGGKANYAFVGMNGIKTATFGIRSVESLIKLGVSMFIV